MALKKGQWVDQLGLEIVPFEARPDRGRFTSGPYYRLKEVFTTREGSWEPGGNLLGSIDAWAVEEWWQGAKWKGAGGARHSFIMVLDEQGQPMKGKGLYWFKGAMTPNFDPSDKRDAWDDGTENIPLYDSYMPERGERGSYSCSTVGRADVLVGLGLPGNLHTSVFAVWQAVAAEENEPPVEPPTEDATVLLRIAVALEKLVRHFGAV
jgi:hypothetical protein